LTPKDRVLSALRGERVDRVPVSAVTQVGTVEAMAKTQAFWPDAHSDPEKMAALGVSLYRLAGLEAARIPFCLTVQAEAMGCPVDMGKGDRPPTVVAHSQAQIDQVALPPGYLDRGRIPMVIRATELLRSRYPDLPVMVGMEGPFTLAGHLVGIERLMLMTIRQRETVMNVVDICTKASVEYARALIDAGADVIVPCDPSASPELMSPKDFSSMVKPKLQELAQAISKRGGIGVLHICGRVQRIMKDMAETGFDSLSIEEKVDLSAAKALIGPKPTLVGNVSAANTLFLGRPEQVREEAKKALAAGVDVLAPGCGIAPRTPLENIRALVGTST